ncbi:MAG: Lar family restriction alleviation protein [Planctomycetaceae bacterium]|nr:Lar family restriction alleviation protein [Planctomycetaceae bacterium]
MSNQACPLPCPFCGSVDIGMGHHHTNIICQCRNCFASGPYLVAEAQTGSVAANDASAIALWNDRIRTMKATAS